MLAIGDVLQNRYRVIRQLGHGGMGTVYEAHDERFENSVALKEVLLDLAKIADPAQQQMVARAFEREAKTLALLHHEAFPHVIDYFSESDHQYLIMELIRGEDLGEQLQARKKPFEFEEVLDWTKQLLDALDYLHTQEQPIIHRDLKPQNMKITARGKVKVLDFGIAKGADNKSSSTITNQTFVAATLNYSPIEQLLRVLDPTFREFISQRHKEQVEDILEHTADARSDLYSLGATLYQLLTATQPHDTLKRALDLWSGKPDPLPNPMELNPKIPPFFNSILLKSMEIDRDSRFVSAAEMQQAIKQFMEAESKNLNQAAWLAEHQKAQRTAPPEIGMQTQLRIADEQRFLEGLEAPAGAPKSEVLSPVAQNPLTAAASTPHIPSVNNEAEERRRIAEQQKFLAELDSPAANAGGNAPLTPAVNQGALTDYGQILPHGHQQQADQTNYAPIKASADQTQVSYLANVLPATPASKAADATVINPQVRNEAPAVVAATALTQTAEETKPNKLLWLIPVGAVGALLLVGVVGTLAYFALRTPEPAKPSSNVQSGTTTYTPAPEPSVAPSVMTAETPGISDVKTEIPSTAGTPAVTTSKPGAANPPKPAATEIRAKNNDAPAQQQPKAVAPKPQPKAEKPARTGGGGVTIDDFGKKP